MKRFPLLLSAAAAAFTACASPASQKAVLPDDRPAGPVSGVTSGLEQAPIYRETGTASWYGREMHGKATASGELFDMHGLSAAHRTLPLGTVVRVTNLETFQSVRLRVNDRGPLVRERVIELSYGAAKELGFVAQGTAVVKIESAEPVPDHALYTVHAAMYAEETQAKMLKDRLSRRFETVLITPFESNVGTFYRVRVGAYASEEKAQRVAAKLTGEGLEPLVIRKD